MAHVIWAEPALQDLDTIADYIALDDPNAAKRLVGKVFQKVDQLLEFPETGTRPRKLDSLSVHIRVIRGQFSLHFHS